MIDIQTYIADLIDLLKGQFKERLIYIGLQGSYLREEATDSSDIDVMVVIDGLTVSDLDAYRSVIQSLPDFDRSCGFICSKEDLANWNPLERCHVLHSTKDCFGTLNDLIPAYTEQDIRNFIKLSLNNLYHEICHRYIHADMNSNIEALPMAYKGAFFILQNLYYVTHGEFIMTKGELLSLLDGKHRAVLQRALDMQRGIVFDFQECFELLFSWCQETLTSL